QRKKGIDYVQFKTVVKVKHQHFTCVVLKLLEGRVPFCSSFLLRQRQEREWRHVTAQQCEPKQFPMHRGYLKFVIVT
ncbi:hypothetical protein DVA81_18540, partial [Acinetobacter baumannii]